MKDAVGKSKERVEEGEEKDCKVSEKIKKECQLGENRDSILSETIQKGACKQ